MSLLLKSIFSLIMLAQVVVALYSGLEIMGRERNRFSLRMLRWVHLINGYIFIALFLVLSYYCLALLAASRGEISARALLHSLFAIGVILMLTVKITFVRGYRKFMGKVPTFGLTIFFLSVGLVATSGGYYFVVSAETAPASQETSIKQTDQPTLADNKQGPDQAKVKKGKKLFNRWCFPCHNPDSRDTKVGPGLKGILKREKLPVSGRVATPDNIRRQIRTPYRLMPSYTHLPDEEIEHIIEFLKTL